MAASFISNETCDVRYWHLASFRCDVKIGRFWTKADKLGFWASDGLSAFDPTATFQSGIAALRVGPMPRLAPLISVKILMWRDFQGAAVRNLNRLGMAMVVGAALSLR